MLPLLALASFKTVQVAGVDLGVIPAAGITTLIGGTVGGRKAKLIEAAADKAGIRVLNRRNP